MKTRKTRPSPVAKQKLPFIEHVYELRRRLFKVAVSVVFFGGVGYGFQQQLVSFLLKPSAGQQFIYTSPGGGINFLFQVCIYFGVVLSIPIIMYQLFKYMEPLIPQHSKKFIIRCSFFSIVLAFLGLCFGYFIGLPAALHFLTHQFTNTQVKPLFTVQEYMSFVSIYLVGSAVLFQIPLILLFANRITPLKPSKLLKQERYVILAAFIMAAVITPTPDIFNQSIIAGPIIGVYQFGIVLVWWHNRRHPLSHLEQMRRKDAELKAERLARRQTAVVLPSPPLPAKKPTQKANAYRPKQAAARSAFNLSSSKNWGLNDITPTHRLVV